MLLCVKIHICVAERKRTIFVHCNRYFIGRTSDLQYWILKEKKTVIFCIDRYQNAVILESQNCNKNDVFWNVQTNVSSTKCVCFTAQVFVFIYILFVLALKIYPFFRRMKRVRKVGQTFFVSCEKQNFLGFCLPFEMMNRKNSEKLYLHNFR